MDYILLIYDTYPYTFSYLFYCMKDVCRYEWRALHLASGDLKIETITQRFQ
jgi:hypothetical protein